MIELPRPIRRTRYGLRADTPDVRDLLYDGAAPTSDEFDLSPSMPSIYNQANANSCVGNGVGAAMEHLWMAKGADFMPSRLFLYYNARLLEGDVAADNGATIRDGLRAAAHWGVCHEALWPYDVTHVADQPPPESYADGAAHTALVYLRVQRSLDQLQGCLTAGYPVVFGMACYQSFETEQVARTGILPMPSLGEAVAGTHCVVLVGFSNSRQVVKVRNSWGVGWGDAGSFWMPYPYLLNRNLTSDFWTIRQAS